MSYKEPFQLTLDAFQTWKEDTRILYASDGRSKLKMYVSLNGSISIERNKETIWIGIQPFPAIEAFNAFSKEFTF